MSNTIADGLDLLGVRSAAAAALAAAQGVKQTFGGSGALGDITFAAPAALSGIFNYHNVTINVGVVMTVGLNRALHLKCSGNLTVNGTLNGSNYIAGGAGGAGGFWNGSLLLSATAGTIGSTNTSVGYAAGGGGGAGGGGTSFGNLFGTTGAAGGGRSLAVSTLSFAAELRPDGAQAVNVGSTTNVTFATVVSDPTNLRSGSSFVIPVGGDGYYTITTRVVVNGSASYSSPAGTSNTTGIYKNGVRISTFASTTNPGFGGGAVSDNAMSTSVISLVAGDTLTVSIDTSSSGAGNVSSGYFIIVRHSSTAGFFGNGVGGAAGNGGIVQTPGTAGSSFTAYSNADLQYKLDIDPPFTYLLERVRPGASGGGGGGGSMGSWFNAPFTYSGFGGNGGAGGAGGNVVVVEVLGNITVATTGKISCAGVNGVNATNATAPFGGPPFGDGGGGGGGGGGGAGGTLLIMNAGAYTVVGGGVVTVAGGAGGTGGSGSAGAGVGRTNGTNGAAGGTGEAGFFRQIKVAV